MKGTVSRHAEVIAAFCLLPLRELTYICQLFLINPPFAEHNVWRQIGSRLADTSFCLQVYVVRSCTG